MRKIWMAAFLCVGALPALAQTPTGPAPTPEMRAAHEQCKAAMEAACPGIQPGGGRLKECLKQQGKEFKDVCPQEAALHQQEKGQGRRGPQGGQNGAGPAGSPPSSVAQPPSSQD